MKIIRVALSVLSAIFFLGCNGIDDNGQEPVIPSESGLPELPADPQPASTSFKHRIMLLQHTGTDCPNCPRLMSSLKEIAEDPKYNNLYHHVAAHSYNKEGDAAYSTAAANLSQAFCSGYYPELTFNLTKENTGTSIAVETIKAKIDGLVKEHADAGIAAAAKVSGDEILIQVGIKAATENQYRLAVWVLEDNIESVQSGATENWQHTHNNAIRAMYGSTLNVRIYGEKLDHMQEGDVRIKGLTIPLDKSWNTENCKLLILANVTDRDGKYDMANCAICPVNGSVSYDYN